MVFITECKYYVTQRNKVVGFLFFPSKQSICSLCFSACTDKYLMLYDGKTPKLPGERGHVCSWEQIDGLCRNVVIPHQCQANRNTPGQGRSVTCASPAQLERLPPVPNRNAFAFICGLWWKDKRGDFQKPWWEARAAIPLTCNEGLGFCCGSETSLLFLSCPGCWWESRCACATFWTPLGTKVVLTYFVCCLGWACFHEEQSVITHTSPSLSSMCCRTMSLENVTWKIKVPRTYCLYALCWSTGGTLRKRLEDFLKVSCCSVVWGRFYLVTCKSWCCKDLFQVALEIHSMYLPMAVLTGKVV